jgi:hypothetical protein
MAMVAIWARMRGGRRAEWVEGRLKYEEVPEAEIHGLNLLR